MVKLGSGQNSTLCALWYSQIYTEIGCSLLRQDVGVVSCEFLIFLMGVANL